MEGHEEEEDAMGQPKSAIKELHEWLIMNVSGWLPSDRLRGVAIRGQERGGQGEVEFQGSYRTS